MALRTLSVVPNQLFKRLLSLFSIPLHYSNTGSCKLLMTEEMVKPSLPPKKPGQLSWISERYLYQTLRRWEFANVYWLEFWSLRIALFIPNNPRISLICVIFLFSIVDTSSYGVLVLIGHSLTGPTNINCRPLNRGSVAVGIQLKYTLSISAPISHSVPPLPGVFPKSKA